MRHYFDPDFRPLPKTKKFCCVCSRDIKHEVAGRIHLDDLGMEAIDSAEEDFDADFIGNLGPECLKKIPKELLI